MSEQEWGNCKFYDAVGRTVLEKEIPMCLACNRRKRRCDHECVVPSAAETMEEAQEAMRKHLEDGGRHPNWDNEEDGAQNTTSNQS